MVDAGPAVCRGGTFVEGEGCFPLSLAHALRKSAVHIPELQDVRFKLVVVDFIG